MFARLDSKPYFQQFYNVNLSNLIFLGVLGFVPHPLARSAQENKCVNSFLIECTILVLMELTSQKMLRTKLHLSRTPADYTVIFFCFLHFLISSWLNTHIFCFETPPLQLQISKHNQNYARGFCIANDMKTTRMIRLKKITRCPEYFQTKKICIF